jgi:hypothetical protein
VPVPVDLDHDGRPPAGPERLDHARGHLDEDAGALGGDNGIEALGCHGHILGGVYNPRVADGSAEAAGALVVHLHYAGAPDVDAGELAAEVRRALPQSDLFMGDPATIAHHGTIGGGRQVPILTAVAVSARHGIDLSQSRAWPDAGGMLRRCDASLAVVEMMGRSHAPADRVRVFRATVLAVVRLTRPLAAWWPTAAQALPPPVRSDPDLMGLLNVRLFRVEGTDGDVVMDTLGLHAFGLPDLQCHCRGLDAPRLATLLMDTGRYVFLHGDVVGDGHTVEGLERGQCWRCRHETSLVAPERVVVDLDPGPPHAAGVRGG